MWPSTARPRVTPPAGRAFPQTEYATLLAAIPRVIARDTTILEEAGAISVPRTARGRPYWETISFDPPPLTAARRPAPAFARRGFGVPVAPAHPETVRITNPSRPWLRRFREDARAFRERLEAAPESTMTTAAPTAPVGTGSPPGTRPGMVATHTEDFVSVNWFGTLYDFTPLQRKVVQALWQAAIAGRHGLSNEQLTAAAKTKTVCVRDIFMLRRNKQKEPHPAFGEMIVQSDTKGIYRLAIPPGGRLDP